MERGAHPVQAEFRFAFPVTREYTPIVRFAIFFAFVPRTKTFLSRPL
jgi:hypothetical protein